MSQYVQLNFLFPAAQTYLEIQGEKATEIGGQDGYEKGLNLWANLQARISQSSAEREAFESTITSGAMQKSWRILDEWWNGRYYPAARDVDDNGALLQLIKNCEELHDDKKHAGGIEATYESSLAYLFAVEMVWYQSVQVLDGALLSQLPPRIIEILKEIDDKATMARSNGLEYAAWQMIGAASYQELMGTDESHTARRVTMSSTLEPCEWLRSQRQPTMRPPRYLWDRISAKTVETASLPNGVSEYYCLSHTWGRWRTKDVPFPGVPWLVPLNKRFDVPGLPEAFRKLDWPVRYIWFDLFCIPQQACSEQAEEVRKQAEIFQQAAGTVVWLNDIQGWKLLEDALMWMGLNFLRCTDPEDEELQERFRALTEELNQVSTRMTGGQGQLNPWCPLPEIDPTTAASGKPYQGDPGPKWFSSLWTLQEAYLCPGAFLADSNFKFLGIGDRVLVTLDNLTSLAFSPATTVKPGEQLPSMVDIFQFTMKRWELKDLTKPSRNSLFIAAESRVATGSRADAIMSALGITDWFEDYRSKHDGQAPNLPAQELVMGIYPLPFLREAQRKMGGMFWMHRRRPPNTIADVEADEPLGTLLPLAHNGRDWQVAQASLGLLRNWPSSDALVPEGAWEIQLNGSVVITRAAVVAQQQHGVLEGNTRDGPVVASEVGGGYQQFPSFLDWMSTLPPVPFRIAVAVARYGHKLVGVVLEGKSSESPDGRTRLLLVKTDIFNTEGTWCTEDTARVSPVDWVVL